MDDFSRTWLETRRLETCRIKSSNQTCRLRGFQQQRNAKNPAILSDCIDLCFWGRRRINEHRTHETLANGSHGSQWNSERSGRRRGNNGNGNLLRTV